MSGLQVLNNMLAGAADAVQSAVLPGSGLLHDAFDSVARATLGVDSRTAGGVDTSSLEYRSGNELLGPMVIFGISLAGGGMAGGEAVAAEGLESVSVFWSPAANNQVGRAGVCPH